MGMYCASRSFFSLFSLLPVAVYMILETVVGRARWCVWVSDCREARRQQADACNNERQRQAHTIPHGLQPVVDRSPLAGLDQACQRVRSGRTLLVNAIKDQKANIHI